MDAATSFAKNIGISGMATDFAGAVRIEAYPQMCSHVLCIADQLKRCISPYFLVW
jgi:hypothetical protein